MHQAVDHEMTLDHLQRRLHTSVVWRQEADEWNKQRAGVEVARSVTLHESSELAVVALLADLRVDRIAQLAPALDGTLDLKAFDALDGAVERHPGHDLGVRELPPTAANLPKSLVGLLPNRFQMFDQLVLQVPFGALRRQAAIGTLEQGVHDLAEDIDLQLLGRGIADANWPCPLVAGKSRNLPFLETALSRQAVHDLHLGRGAGNGVLQPGSPGLRLAVEAAVHQGKEGEGGIAQPAIAIIPVARAADAFRQRCCRRCDDATRRTVGECLQRYQRA